MSNQDLSLVVDMLRESLDRHSDKLDALGTDVAIVKTKVEHIEAEQDTMSTKLDGLDSRLDKLEARPGFQWPLDKKTTLIVAGILGASILGAGKEVSTRLWAALLNAVGG